MSKSMDYFCKLIVMENFFGINRNFLLKNPLKKEIGDYISILAPIVLISVLVFDTIIKTDIYLRAFQLILLIELTGLALIARLRKNTFETIAKLDVKCGINDEYFKEITRKVALTVYFSITSVAIDAIGLYLLDTRLAVIVVLVILFSAHDTELAFFALLVDCMNLRLSTLKEQHPNVGCRIYRHVLTVSSHINEEFTPRILLMVGIIVFTTVVYSFIIFLADPSMIWKLSVYLFWRESKSLYSLWAACYSAAKSKEICRRLAFHMAARLGLDPTISQEKNSKLHKTVRRWHATVISFPPCFITGSVLTIGLGVPLMVIDISINYMIIIVQIYVAYK